MSGLIWCIVHMERYDRILSFCADTPDMPIVQSDDCRPDRSPCQRYGFFPLPRVVALCERLCWYLSLSWFLARTGTRSDSCVPGMVLAVARYFYDAAFTHDGCMSGSMRLARKTITHNIVGSYVDDPVQALAQWLQSESERAKERASQAPILSLSRARLAPIVTGQSQSPSVRSCATNKAIQLSLLR